MQLGDTVNLVRKITNEKLALTLAEVLVHRSKPAVVAYWKSIRNSYMLNLDTNEVLAIDMKPDHRQQMRRWYSIDEDDRKALTELFWATKKGAKKGHAK